MTPMLLLASAALVIPHPVSRVEATVQATATIRVVAGTVVKFGGSPGPAVPPARVTIIRTADGSAQQAKVIDFQ